MVLFAGVSRGLSHEDTTNVMVSITQRRSVRSSSQLLFVLFWGRQSAKTGTASHGIYIRCDSPLSLHAFSDADWAGDQDDYLSTNAYIIYLGSTPISWSAKKQSDVARSSTEAEYKAVVNTASELCWICSLLTELDIKLPAAPVIYCDNVGATYLCANPVFHSRMKHLALDYHFIRGNVQSGALRDVRSARRRVDKATLTTKVSRTVQQDWSYKNISILRGDVESKYKK